MRDWVLTLWLCAVFPFIEYIYILIFSRPSYSRNCYRILLLPSLNDILSTSRLDRQTILRSSIPLSGHLDHRSNHSSRLRRSPSRIRLRYLFRMDGLFNKQTEESVFSAVSSIPYSTLQLSSSSVLGCHLINSI
jgi:hypothetical protein